MMIKILFVVLASSFLTACCSTGTTVVLVPDAGGKVGQVSLTTEGGTALLSKANESAGASKAKQPPTPPVLLSEKKVHAMFADTLAKEPTPPKRYSLYFPSGSVDLTADANAEIPKIVAEIQARKSCDLSVIGHSDTVGDNEDNKGISIARAETVAKSLTDAGIDHNCMDIRYYGENDLAVPTADNVDEPLNRRAEVEIR
jgi:outer membrane protein OmpA-like peptidoglycan-associated protein